MSSDNADHMSLYNGGTKIEHKNNANVKRMKQLIEAQNNMEICLNVTRINSLE